MRSEAVDDDRHLFVDDEELRRRINPKIGRDRFRSALRALEAKYPDFPKFMLCSAAATGRRSRHG
jgi:hypothetical protein